jgi:uncharacterized membrane protein
MAELDHGYKNLISVILNLNHDRYKSYFNYFIVLHLGMITAIGTNFGEQIDHSRQFLCILGIVLSIVWLLVLYKIQRDIREAWRAIEQYESSEQYDGAIRISKTLWKGFSASKLMLAIPCSFLVAYVFILAKT